MERTIDIIQSSALPLFWALLKMTIPLTLISFAFGMVLALITALARISKNRFLLKWHFLSLCLDLPRNSAAGPIIHCLFWTSFSRSPNGCMDSCDFNFFTKYWRVCF